MKQQTFIVLLKDAENSQKDFYRFTYKKPETVLNKLKEAVKNNPDFWSYSWKDCTIVQCFATPDGYNKSAAPVWQVNISTLFE